jgi:uncharacterized membrane protein YraQ (UPF0718 family)
VIGFLIAGVISVYVPASFFETYLGNDLVSMLLMLVIGIPMYVCATASTPIAAALIMNGLSPGAGLVFLLTGPATNAITISTVVRTMGKKAVAVYLLSISAVSLGLGYILNLITKIYTMEKIILTHNHEMIPEWFKITGAVLLLGMLLYYFIVRYFFSKFKRSNAVGEEKTTIIVKGMTCMHCAGNVKKAVESVDGVSDVNVNLDDNTVSFLNKNESSISEIKKAVQSAGYEIE